MNAIFIIRRLVVVALNIILGLLAILFILRFLGANAGTPFVQFIQALASPFYSPFRGIFASTAVSGATIDWSIITAMLVYGIIGAAIIQALRLPLVTEERRLHTIVD